ncbi:MAG: hypothetical protein UY39_C0018G0009 [Candidatus Kaiserbacteria bacterium GW2011_GWC2_49_12]|uniref:Uncharacterized protein n=3 Tax=Candidatus Kaiseribacteriota TaxID=1752734 RepID=A0A0G1ZEL4_9BACT|nr:MAG: hypothetical protein UY39_C0018G0009 [Candidatus Kaiserbacteria bacterium GW2011_GWC2_49_12]KKW17649.1 MAG: hypothetical protein UY57_C0013G0008 [Candidatus Kaiserbacteria bacterium GW2011_GWB1_50_17]OGG87229.1 MAG: hypothetical protein A3H15_01395 [Candidatus Kaiserbacteria bacterium RIFCSPLOWO2_12_FULL_50_28]HCM43456.1 hypothetical protein [Candidatus Kaiserbacteria bacterium]
MTILRIPLWALGLFILLALLIEAPLIAFPFFAGERYQGINIAHFGNDEHYYLTRAREVLDGHSLGQPILAEGKQNPDSFLYNDEQIAMSPFTMTRTTSFVDVVTYYNTLNFAGLIILLTLIFLFVKALSGDPHMSAAAAIFAVGGYLLIENGTILSVIAHGKDVFYNTFNIFGRSNFPYMPLIPFYGALIAIYYAHTQPLRLSPRENMAAYAYVLTAGILFGLLFYLYFYAWTFMLAILGGLTLFALASRKWDAALSGVAITCIGLLIGGVKLAAFYSLYTSPIADQLAHFFLSIDNRQFIMSTTGLATTLLFAFYFYMRKSDPNNLFIAALIAAGWVALEQQMITGRSVQYGHYYWYFIVPLSILVSIYMCMRLLPDRMVRFRVALSVLLIAAALVHTGGTQYKSFFTTADNKLREQDFAPVLTRLSEEIPAIVLGDPGGESYPFLTTIYTSHDLYWNNAATVSIFPMEYLREALFVYLYLNKDARDDPVGYLRTSLASTSNAYTVMYENIESVEADISLTRYHSSRTDTEIISAREQFLPILEKEYRALVSSVGAVRNILTENGVRYVLWDKRETPEWDLSVLSPLTLIATSTDIELYSLSTK